MVSHHVPELCNMQVSAALHASAHKDECPAVGCSPLNLFTEEVQRRCVGEDSSKVFTNTAPFWQHAPHTVLASAMQTLHSFGIIIQPLVLSG